MELEYFKETELVHEILKQIRDAIKQLQDWNKDVESMFSLEKTPLGMQRLAGNYMLIQAIGEGVKKIDKYTDGKLWTFRPEIPWRRVMGMRDRISHGYFELDTGYIDDIIKNDLAPLLEAIEYLIILTNNLLVEKTVDEQMANVIKGKSVKKA